MDDGADRRDAGAADDAALVVVLVERTGGIAGLTRRWRAEARDPEAKAWQELIDACPWDAPARAMRGADRFRWRVHAAAGGTDREAEFGDAALDGAWRRLVDRVREDGERC